MSTKPQRLPDPIDSTESDVIQLWMVQGPFSDERERDALWRLLSPEERARADRFRAPEVRHVSIVSRGLIRKLLAERLQCAPERIEMRTGRHGKPRLAGVHAGAGIEFNVSHSGDIVLFAISAVGPVGVDVERIRPHVDLAPIAQRFFAAEEARQLLEDLPVEQQLDGFFRCWTRKEAYLKAKGSGLTQRLDAFAVTLRPADLPAMTRVDVEGAPPESWRVFDIPVPSGYHAALVVRPTGRGQELSSTSRD